MEKYKISVGKAAKILGMSKKTVYKRLRSGKLDGQKRETKYGEQWFINESEFEDESESIIKDTVEDRVDNGKETVRKGVSRDELIEILKASNKTLIEKIDAKIQNSINQSIAFIYKELLEFQKERNQEIKKLNQKTGEMSERIKNRDQELIQEIRNIQIKKKKSLFTKIKELFGLASIESTY